MEKTLDIINKALKKIKSKDINIIEVERLTQMMNYMIICTATSNTHADAISKNLKLTVKNSGIKILGMEGQSNSGWILVDLGDIVIHIMLKEMREFYQLEKLWINPKTDG